MPTILKLFKLQIDEKMNIFRSGKWWKVLLTIFLYLAIIAGASVGLIYAFIRFNGIGLAVDTNLFAVLLMFTQILSFVIALGSIIKNLYHSKENDLLMSLPCSHNQVFISKLMVLYFYELVANTLYTTPIFIMYSFVSNVNIGYYFLCLLFLFLLPLISLVFAGFFSIPIMYISNKLKKYPVWASAVLVIVVAVLLGLYMYLIISFTSSIDFSGKQSTILSNINDIIARISVYSGVFRFMAEGILAEAGWWWKDIVIIAFTAIMFVLTVLIVKKFYFNLAMKNSETTTKARRGKDYIEPPFKSILRKETYTIFREPGNVFQYFIFTILMPFIVLLYDKMLLSITVNQTGQAMIVASHVLVVAILAMLSNIVSATAISREGGNFYISKLSPASPRLQTNAKIVFNLIFTYGALIITAIFTAIFTDIPILYNILTTIAVAIMSLGHIITSVLIDLKKPVLDWFDSNDIEKMSKSTKISMVLGLVFAFLMFIIVVVFAPTSHTELPWYILIGSVSLYTIAIMIYYHLRINKIYQKVEC